MVCLGRNESSLYWSIYIEPTNQVEGEFCYNCLWFTSYEPKHKLLHNRLPLRSEKVGYETDLNSETPQMTWRCLLSNVTWCSLRCIVHTWTRLCGNTWKTELLHIFKVWESFVYSYISLSLSFQFSQGDGWEDDSERAAFSSNPPLQRTGDASDTPYKIMTLKVIIHSTGS